MVKDSNNDKIKVVFITLIMQTSFGGVPKMLTGKKFPQNMRALRMVVEELLSSIMVTSEDYEQLNKQEQSSKAVDR